jgi:hypothetical protein
MFGGKKDERKPAEEAGYLELVGAKKDAECKIVKVAGGISSQRGCCNLFEPRFQQVTEFRCGTCEYVTEKTGAH